MTAADPQRAALVALIEAVENCRLCTIPTPHVHARVHTPDLKARIMGYVEGYVVMRHERAMPFIEGRREVLAHLRRLMK